MLINIHKKSDFSSDQNYTCGEHPLKFWARSVQWIFQNRDRQIKKRCFEENNTFKVFVLKETHKSMSYPHVPYNMPSNNSFSRIFSTLQHSTTAHFSTLYYSIILWALRLAHASESCTVLRFSAFSRKVWGKRRFLSCFYK